MSFPFLIPFPSQYSTQKTGLKCTNSQKIFSCGLWGGGSFQEFNLGPPTEKTAPRFQIRRTKRRGSFRLVLSQNIASQKLLSKNHQQSQHFSTSNLLLFFFLSGQLGVVSTPRNSGKARAAARLNTNLSYSPAGLNRLDMFK